MKNIITQTPIPPNVITDAEQAAWKLRDYADFNVYVLLILLAIIGLAVTVLFLNNQ